MKKFTLFILIFFLTWNLSNGQENIPYGNNPSAGGYVNVNGIQMYYEIYGTGEPLVLIHPNAGSIANFYGQIPFFSKHYKVIVADSRAHGKSGDSNQKLSFQLMASDWASLLDQLKIDSAYICCWSDGGSIGLILAMDYPKKVKKLASMSGAILSDTTVYPKFVFEFNNKALQYIDEKIAGKDTTDNWRLLRKPMEILTELNIPFSDLHKIKAPTIIMAADKDMIREEHTIKIFQNIEKAHLCIFPGETHDIPWQDPEIFNQAVYRFFSNPYIRPDTESWFKAFNKDMSKFYGN
jgi:pimeloyl-ACP methyl ester carboxylesterase